MDRKAGLEGLSVTDQRRYFRLISIGIVACGFIIRVFIWLYDRSLELDEAMLASNLVFRDFCDVLLHLEDNQIAPPIFLALSKISLVAFGDVVISLHLAPMLSGAVALCLLSALLQRLVPGWFAVGTTAIAAFHVLFLRYSMMFKQYSCDYLATTILLLIAVDWRSISARRRCLIAATLPFLMGLSLTSAFGLFALFVVSVWEAMKQRSKQSYIPSVVLALTTSLVSGVLWFFFLRQYRSVPFFFEFWRSGFPRGNFAWWAIRAVADVLTYLVGYPPLRALWGLLSMMGLVTLFSRKTQAAGVFSIACLFAGLAAAILGFYPFAPARVTLWLLPVATVCLTKGVSTFWHVPSMPVFRPAAIGVMLFLLLWTGASIVIQGGELLGGEQMEAVLEVLRESESADIPLLVSKSASYSFGLFYSERTDKASFVTLPRWAITVEQIHSGWDGLGGPQRFWLVLSGGDFEHIKPVWPVLLGYCKTEQVIERGSSAAYLLELRHQEE